MASTPGATPIAACRKARRRRRCSAAIRTCRSATSSSSWRRSVRRPGFPADADIRHRCAVRLTAVAITDGQGRPLVDPLFESGTGAPIRSAAQLPTPVTQIQWSQDDALPFPVCISSTFVDATGAKQSIADVSIVVGNVVLADQGLSMPAVALPPVPAPTPLQARRAPTAATRKALRRSRRSSGRDCRRRR